MTLLLASCILSCDALNLLKFTQRQPSLARSRIGCGIQQLDRGGGGGGLTTTATFAKVPTDDDVLHQTLHQLGVQGIASHFNPRGVAVCTTSKSVAGRGAFWSPLATGSEQETIQQGDVLAYIPKSSILTLSNIDSIMPSQSDTNNINKEEAFAKMNEFASLSAKYSWPVGFTLYVHAVAQQNEAFREWIESFMGPGPPICPSPAGDANENECIFNEAVQDLVSMAQVSEETAKEASVARYQSFKRDWSAAKEWLETADDTSSRCINVDELQFTKLCSILISRTANLGPIYERDSISKNASVRGVIPLHDMINHPPPSIEYNVELFTVGDVRGMLSEERLQQLVGMVFEHNNNTILDDKDALLIARREILPGDELFLSYRNNRAKPMEEKERAWTTLQYGFLIQ